LYLHFVLQSAFKIIIMSKLSLRFYLLVSILTVLSMCIVHEQFSITLLRLVSIVFLSSACTIPGVLVFNAIFSFIRSFKLVPTFSWIILVVIISSFNHLMMNVFVLLGITDWNTAHPLLLILNSSSFLALLIQFSSIHHLFKSSTYEKEQPLTLG
jgi:hypothetical protein